MRVQCSEVLAHIQKTRYVCQTNNTQVFINDKKLYVVAKFIVYMPITAKFKVYWLTCSCKKFTRSMYI